MEPIWGEQGGETIYGLIPLPSFKKKKKKKQAGESPRNPPSSHQKGDFYVETIHTTLVATYSHSYFMNNKICLH